MAFEKMIKNAFEESRNNTRLGDTFEEIFKCEPTEGDHEFSYPAMVAQGNILHITYTHEREGIVYQQVEIN